MSDQLTPLILVVLMAVAFYLLILRPQRKRQAEQKKTEEALRPGARVMLAAGVYGDVVSIGEKQAVVEIAPGVPVTVLRQVIVEVVTPESRFAEDDPTSDDPPTAVEAARTEDPDRPVDRAGADPADRSGPVDEDDRTTDDPDKA